MLILLSIISTAIAALQVYPYYGDYGMYGYPVANYPVANYPVAYYPPLANYPVRLYTSQPQQEAEGKVEQRSLIRFGNFREINGRFQRSTTAPASIIEGTFNIQQNGLFDIFAGGEAKFSMWIRSSQDLTGNTIIVSLGTGANCQAAISNTIELARITAPLSFNGFYIKGTTRNHNIDGMSGKMSLTGANKWLVLTRSSGTPTHLGCSVAALQ